VPIDAIGGAVPKVLHSLSAGAVEVFDAARFEDWRGASTALARITGAWAAFARRDAEAARRGDGLRARPAARSGRGAKTLERRSIPLST